MWAFPFLTRPHPSLPVCPWRALWFGPIVKAVFVAFTLSLPQSNLDCLVRSYIVIMQLSVFLCSVLKPGFVFPFVVFRSWLCLPFPLCTPVLPQPLSPEPACLTSPAGAHRVSTGLPPGWHHTSVCLAHAPPLGYCPPAHTYTKHIIHLPRLLYVSSFGWEFSVQMVFVLFDTIITSCYVAKQQFC